MPTTLLRPGSQAPQQNSAAAATRTACDNGSSASHLQVERRILSVMNTQQTAGQALRAHLDEALPKGVVWTKIELATLDMSR